ncbi:phosphinothricin acetyltransferase [Flavobacterium arsenatis]|uniref:Phosphinothricin acetyltransferase n=1 Tax=Flavobacterium arsenatis TaxID=1484332 RepID=A0ABU1TR20_9FLAO|nr:N-acetyltransferase family protein [Flavobacterium arsenatis]MDR6968399.1 phosphinothricin acetyltransferase [Flavobacterium arsenatis]
MEIKIRFATLADLPAILEIVNHAILNTTAIYDYDARTLEEQKNWFEEKQISKFPVIVAENDKEVLGFGTFGNFRVKVGYRFTIEHSVYVTENAIGKGVGKLLLQKLIDLAKEQKYHSMIGVIDASNSGSIEFHKKFGFKETGILKEAGYKFDKWLDVSLMQLVF